MSEYIVDDRGQHELWEEIQKMTDAEREVYIRQFEENKYTLMVGEDEKDK